MAFPSQSGSPVWPDRQPVKAHLWAEQVFHLVLAAVIVLLSGGCAAQQILAGPAPTLVATLALSIPRVETPALSATRTLAPTPALATETPDPGYTATRTITPWPSDTSTAGPSPTATRTPTHTRVPTRTFAPTLTRAPTRTLTITNTPTPPAPVLHIVRPGLLSKLVSPIQMELYVLTGHQGLFTIELVGEDSRVISRQVLNRGTEAGRRYWLAPALPFEIQAAAETARLQVSIQDEFGRTAALSSVDVLLLSVGRNELNPALIDQEPYLIRRPRTDDTVSGGTLVIEALARPVNDSPLFIELITEKGAVMSVKRLEIDPPTGSLSHTPFTVEIPYRVSQTTPVRLVIRQGGGRIPGAVALTSRTIILEP